MQIMYDTSRQLVTWVSSGTFYEPHLGIGILGDSTKTEDAMTKGMILIANVCHMFQCTLILHVHSVRNYPRLGRHMGHGLGPSQATACWTDERRLQESTGAAREGINQIIRTITFTFSVS